MDEVEEKEIKAWVEGDVYETIIKSAREARVGRKMKGLVCVFRDTSPTFSLRRSFEESLAAFSRWPSGG